MIATTPSGTRTRSMRRPLGRTQPSSTSPTGSASAGDLQEPARHALDAASVSRSRSTTVAATPRPRPGDIDRVRLEHLVGAEQQAVGRARGGRRSWRRSRSGPAPVTRHAIGGRDSEIVMAGRRSRATSRVLALDLDRGRGTPRCSPRRNCWSAGLRTCSARTQPMSHAPKAAARRRRWLTGFVSPMPTSTRWLAVSSRWPAYPIRSVRCLDGWVRPTGVRISSCPRAARRGGDHLREPSERHQRRRRGCVSSQATRRSSAVRPERSSSNVESRRSCARRYAKEVARARARAHRRHESRGRRWVHAATEWIDCLIPPRRPFAPSAPSSTMPPCPTSSTGTATAMCTSMRPPISTWRVGRGQREDASGRRCATRPRRCSCMPTSLNDCCRAWRADSRWGGVGRSTTGLAAPARSKRRY